MYAVVIVEVETTWHARASAHGMIAPTTIPLVERSNTERDSHDGMVVPTHHTVGRNALLSKDRRAPGGADGQ